MDSFLLEINFFSEFHWNCDADFFVANIGSLGRLRILINDVLMPIWTIILAQNLTLGIENVDILKHRYCLSLFVQIVGASLSNCQDVHSCFC